jgi:dimethylaniline monooxygenase (N-oxide forming)
MVNELPNCVISGLMKVKGNVNKFTETAVMFEDKSRENDIDAVVFATGYNSAFPLSFSFIHNFYLSFSLR